MAEMFFVPANDGWKLSARVSVSVDPDPLAEDAPTFNVHWLFCSVPLVPNVCDPAAPFPASFAHSVGPHATSRGEEKAGVSADVRSLRSVGGIDRSDATDDVSAVKAVESAGGRETDGDEAVGQATDSRRRAGGG
jgi:hypothetical protein